MITWKRISFPNGSGVYLTYEIYRDGTLIQKVDGKKNLMKVLNSLHGKGK